MKLDQFKEIVFDVSRRLYIKVGKLDEPEVTPNFLSAELLLENKSIYVLCNENNEWAFSSFYDKNNCQLDFIDFEKFSSLLEEIYKVKTYKVEELNDSFEKKDYLLESDINYWKPVTLGEGIFNWWD